MCYSESVLITLIDWRNYCRINGSLYKTNWTGTCSDAYISIEYKAGKITKQSGTLVYPPYLKPGIASYAYQDTGKEEIKEFRKLSNFYKTNEIFRLDDFCVVYHFHELLLRLVLNDIIVEGELESFIEESEKFIKSQVTSHYVNLINKLKFFNYHTDSEFNEAYYKLLAGLENGDLNLNEFTYFADVLYDLLKYEPFMPFDQEKIDSYLEGKVPLIKNNSELSIMQVLHIADSAEAIKGCNEQLYNEILIASEKLKSTRFKEGQEIFLNELKDDKINQNSMWELFRSYSGDKIADWILQNYQKRKALESFCVALERLAKSSFLRQHAKGAIENITQLKSALLANEEFMNFKGIDEYWRKTLLKHLDHFLSVSVENEEEE